jgi:integrase
VARTTQHKNLESPKSRTRLKRGRNAHWRTIIPGRAHLGWQRWEGGEPGRWLVRRFIDGRYSIAPLAVADDIGDADGQRVYSFEQAHAAAIATLDAPKAKIERLTVRQAWKLYSDAKRAEGKDMNFADARARAYILPPLGDKVVAELTNERLRRWLADVAAAPAMIRSKKNGKQNYRPVPTDDEGIRRRRSSANRILTSLKAALNFAYDEGHVGNQEAWGRRLKAFREVDAARLRYLSVAEAQRLLNVCDPDFRKLTRAALLSGARYAELCRLDVADFNPDAGTITIRRSKSGKSRHVTLTDEGVMFFRDAVAGKAGDAAIFTRKDGGRWGPVHQSRPMREANAAARISPPISFHGLRHTYASLSIMNGVPLLVIAKNLGHADVRMIEKHYGHLAPSYIADAIRAGAPRFGYEPDQKLRVVNG